jgi:hypothetical protein
LSLLDVICALQEVRNEFHDFSLKNTEMERKKKKKKTNNPPPPNKQNDIKLAEYV